MIVEDVDLRLPEALPGQPALPAEMRDIAEIVDREGDEDEHREADRDRHAHQLPEIARFLRSPPPLPHAPAPLADMAEEAVKEQHREPDARIQADPLARPADAHEKPAHRERHERFIPVAQQVHLQIAEHEGEHEDDKEDSVAVDGGDTRLRQVHHIERHHKRGEERPARPAQHDQRQRVHDGNHQHARQRAEEAPAERRHAEQLDAQHDENLAQRRMRPFVNGQAVRQLVAGAGMIDFVEVSAVKVTRLVADGVRLVAKQPGIARVLLARAFDGEIRNRQHRSVFRAEDDFHDVHGGAVRRQPRVARRTENPLIRPAGGVSGRVADGRGQIVPAEALAHVKLGGIGFRPRFAVAREFEREVALADFAVIQNVEILLRPQVEGDGFRRAGARPDGLRGLRRTEADKGDARVNRRQRDERERLPEVRARNGLRLGGEGIERFFGRFAPQGAQARQRACSAVQRRPDGKRAEGEVRKRKRRARQVEADGQMRIAQNQRAVEIERRREADERVQQPRVAAIDIRRQQKRQRREKIALVHLRAEEVQQDIARRAAQREPGGLRTLPIIKRERARHGQHGHHRAESGVGNAEDFLAQRRPVRADEVVEVGGVQRRVGVRGERGGIQFKNPRQGLAPRERQQHRNRRGQGDPQPLQRAFDLSPARQKREQPERRGHQRLRLHQRRNDEDGQRGRPVVFFGEVYGQKQAQHHYAVDLPPYGAVQQHGRRERVQHAKQQRRRLAQAPARQPPEQIRRAQIAQARDEAQQHARRRALRAENAQPVQQLAHRPQQIQIPRRVIAEADGIVELIRPYVRQPDGPTEEAVVVRIVAAAADGEQHAQQKRRRQHKADRQPRVKGVEIPEIPQRQRGEQKQQRPRENLRLRGFAGSVRFGDFAVVHLRIIGQLENFRVRGNLVRAREGHVRKPRLAGVIRAVIAQPRGDNHLALVLIRPKPAFQPHELARRVPHLREIDVAAQHGKPRARAAFRNALGAHQTGEMINRVRLHLDGLNEPRVVGGDVFHRGAGAAGKIRHAPVAHAVLAQPGVLRPALGPAGIVGERKIAVIQQVFFLRQRAPGQRQQQKAHQQGYEFAHKCLPKHNVFQIFTLLYYLTLRKGLYVPKCKNKWDKMKISRRNRAPEKNGFFEKSY